MLSSKCRSPLGLRGLKSLNISLKELKTVKSQPTRAAWIEIAIGITLSLPAAGRSPLRLRGLKLKDYRTDGNKSISRSPLGLRGLK